MRLVGAIVLCAVILVIFGAANVQARFVEAYPEVAALYGTLRTRYSLQLNLYCFFFNDIIYLYRNID